MSPAAMAGAGALGAVLLGLALVAGWAAPGRPPATVVALTHGRAPPPASPIRRPGGDMLFALDGLVGELGDAAGAGPLLPERPRFVAPPPPAPPPPPDVAVVFRREAAAVIREQGRGLAVLIDQPGQPTRLIRPGDPFDDRWRLASLTMDEAVLSDGVSQRRVSLFTRPGAGGAFAP